MTLYTQPGPLAGSVGLCWCMHLSTSAYCWLADSCATLRLCSGLQQPQQALVLPCAFVAACNSPSRCVCCPALLWWLATAPAGAWAALRLCGGLQQPQQAHVSPCTFVAACNSPSRRVCWPVPSWLLATAIPGPLRSQTIYRRAWSLESIRERPHNKDTCKLKQADHVPLPCAQVDELSQGLVSGKYLKHPHNKGTCKHKQADRLPLPCAQVDELSQGLVLVTQKMNERLTANETNLKDLRSPQGPSAKVRAGKGAGKGW